MSALRRFSLWLLVLLHVSGWTPAAGAPEPEPKSLARFHDPVVVSTALLSGRLDRRTAHYRVYAASSGALVPVPFQFDARDDDGELVLRPSGTREPSFDDNDELVFMAKDTGDRIAPGDLRLAADSALEIEVRDPVSDERGWAYLVHFPADPPPRSPVVYATFDAVTNEARAHFYTMRYYPGSNFFTGMSIAPAAGGSGENVLDRMKVRLEPTLSLLFTTWSPLFTEEDFSVEIDGIKNGPVRAIRRVRQSIDLGSFFPEVPNGTVYTYYYFSFFTTPAKFSVPWLVLKSLRGFRFTGVSDFRRNVIGMRYWDGANPQGVEFTGRHLTTLNTTTDHDWWVVSGAGGTCLHVFITPPEWREWGIARGTVFIDDDGAIDTEGTDGEPGSHAAGYSLLNMENLRRPGSYDLNLATIILPHPYRPGDEAKPLEMLTAPLKVTVRAFQ